MTTRAEAIAEIVQMAQDALDRSRALVDAGLDPLEAAARVVTSLDGRAVASIALMSIAYGSRPEPVSTMSAVGQRTN